LKGLGRIIPAATAPIKTLRDPATLLALGDRSR
jgi:hypothetical protein